MKTKRPPKIDKYLKTRPRGSYSWDNGAQVFDKKEKGFPKKNEKYCMNQNHIGARNKTEGKACHPRDF